MRHSPSLIKLVYGKGKSYKKYSVIRRSRIDSKLFQIEHACIVSREVIHRINIIKLIYSKPCAIFNKSRGSDI